MAAEQQPRFLTIKDVAAEFATTEHQVRAIINVGDLPAIQIGAVSGALNVPSSRATSSAPTPGQPKQSSEACNSPRPKSRGSLTTYFWPDGGVIAAPQPNGGDPIPLGRELPPAVTMGGGNGPETSYSRSNGSS